jgi:hypothetical protein
MLRVKKYVCAVVVSILIFATLAIPLVSAQSNPNIYYRVSIYYYDSDWIGISPTGGTAQTRAIYHRDNRYVWNRTIGSSCDVVSAYVEWKGNNGITRKQYKESISDATAYVYGNYSTYETFHAGTARKNDYIRQQRWFGVQ